MKIERDLKSPGMIHAKGALFLFLGTLSGMILFLHAPTLTTAVLLGVTIWSFCRFYYYLFYVLERYLGRPQPFAGVFDAIMYLARSAATKAPHPDEPAAPGRDGPP